MWYYHGICKLFLLRPSSWWGSQLWLPINGFSQVSLWCNFCWKCRVVAPSSSQLFSSSHIYAWLRFVVGMKWRSKLIFTTLHTWRHFHLQAITLANSFSMLQVIFFVQTNSCFHLAAVKKKNVQPMPKLNIFFPRCCFPCAGNWDQILRCADTCDGVNSQSVTGEMWPGVVVV